MRGHRPTDAGAVLDLCAEESVDFVIIGPEAPLAAGVADRLRDAGFLTFGPSQAAAQLEASKRLHQGRSAMPAARPRQPMRGSRRPAPRRTIRAKGAPIVVKADGLAAGKGVIVAMDEAAALDAVDDMFSGAFGGAGAEVVIEEYLDGEEASFFVLCDGETVLPIGTAQDHKRAGEGDTGPNTGGMGAYSPAPAMTEDVTRKALESIVKPTVAEMRRRGVPFTGVLFAGLMIADGQPKLIEYNVRFGDPECQCLMLRLGAQALDLMLATAEGRLHEVGVTWAEDHAMSVVMAAKGYPGTYEKGSVINGLHDMPETGREICFHAGTAREAGRYTAAGGRVLALTARGDTLQEARDRAYGLVARVDWPEGFCRSDIGWRALRG